MTICYFDAFSGISGDMTVGALLHAGAPFEPLERAVRSLNVGAAVRYELTKRRGIAAGKFIVEAAEGKAHRHLSHILKLIDGAELAPRARERARRIFMVLGEAEAQVHGVPVEKVHFHEVGAVDSIIDIVGACVCLEELDVDQIYASAVNTGSGTVNTEHGVMPVPAPATALLLKGRPVYARGPALELTTPTGAAILAALAGGFGTLPPMRVIGQGFGAGDRDFPEQANVVRVLLGEVRAAAGEAQVVSVLETNLDDCTPQILGHAFEKLLEAGALDVTVSPVVMKKNRPGWTLTVLAPLAREQDLAEVIFQETTALGLRVSETRRLTLRREHVTVETRFGAVRIKVAGEQFSPEYEDCRQRALEHKAPLRAVLAEATAAYLSQRK